MDGMAIVLLAADGGVPATASALRFDVPVMVACAIACVPISFSGFRITWLEGAALVLYSAAYVGYLVRDATGHDHLPVVGWTVLAFVVPLSLLGTFIATVRQLRSRAMPQPSSSGKHRS